MENKTDKGLKGGSCNRTACQKPGANWYNHSTRAHYCEACALDINSFRPGKEDAIRLYGHDLCTYVGSDPIGRRAAINIISAAFSPDELKGLRLIAGGALMFHGGKDTTNDLDLMPDSLEVVEAIAKRRGLTLSKNHKLGCDGIEFDRFDIYHNPEFNEEYRAAVRNLETTHGDIRVDHPDAIVTWYLMMVRRFDRHKDNENLMKAFTLRKKWRELGRGLTKPIFYDENGRELGFGGDIRQDVVT